MLDGQAPNVCLIVSSSISIIEMDTPWTTRGHPVEIFHVTEPWEKLNGSHLNEAPTHVVSGGTLNLVYSANWFCERHYLCGLVTASIDADPLHPGSWDKHTAGPVFTSANGHFGPGSGTFFNDGTATWFAYGSFTSKFLDVQCHNSAHPKVQREIQAQTVSFDGNGVVQLGSPQKL